MTAAFYNRAQGVVVTFDVSQRDSFDNLKTWISDVKQVSSFFAYLTTDSFVFPSLLQVNV